jgi:hypothetical protein
MASRFWPSLAEVVRSTREVIGEAAFASRTRGSAGRRGQYGRGHGRAGGQPADIAVARLGAIDANRMERGHK